MLIAIKNTGNSAKDTVTVPYSKFKHKIARCLLAEGYIKSASKKTVEKGKSALEIKVLKEEGRPRIREIKRISKPSRRIYFGVKNIRPIKSGVGRLVLSTSKGVMTGEKARKEHVGGEALFQIW